MNRYIINGGPVIAKHNYSRGQGVALAVRDDPRLDGQLEVEVLTLVDELVSPSGSSKAHGTGRPAADRPGPAACCRSDPCYSSGQIRLVAIILDGQIRRLD